LNIAKKELIIFDFDGTLIDSGPDLAGALNHMLTQIQRNTFSVDVIDSWVGNGAQTLVKRALSGSIEIDSNIEKSLFEKSLDIFLKYYEQNVCVHTTIYPDVTTTLKSLHKQGYKLAIVTNKPYKFVAPILKTLNLFDLFEFFIGGDSLALKKPNPEPLLHVCNTLGVSVEKSLMVGDSKNDILAANACKMQSVGVSYGYNYGEDIGVYQPTVVIDNFKEMLRVLNHAK